MLDRILRAIASAALVLAIQSSAVRVEAQAPALLKDINKAPLDLLRSGKPREMTRVGTDVYFVADSDGGPVLWNTDGTPAGTVRVSGLTAKHAYPTGLTALGSALLFACGDATSGRELWVARNGVAQLLRDILPGSASSSPEGMYAHGAHVFFSIVDTAANRSELWRSDGTVTGTTRVHVFTSSGRVRPLDFTSVGAALYFTHVSGGAANLWQTDGTTRGTLHVYAGARYTSRFAELTSFRGKLWFQGSGPAGQELWVSDGTAVGTKLFFDLWPGAVGSAPAELTVVVNRLYFRAQAPGLGHEIWSTDGTTKGMAVIDLRVGVTSSMPQNFASIGSRLYFCADGGQGLEPWYHETTNSTTRLLKDVWVGSRSSTPDYFTAFGNGLVFDGRTATGSQLFYSNGTTAGTVLFSPNLTAFEDDVHGQLESLGQLLLFRAHDAKRGIELFRSAAPPAKTSLVKDVHAPPPGESASSNPSSFVDVGGLLVFRANDGVHGIEPWISDGTSVGTRLVKDIRPGPGSSYPTSFYRAPWGIVFAADDGAHGQELWSTLGIAQRTSMIRDLHPGPKGSAPSSFIELHGRLLFRASHGSLPVLYETDGTTSGTRLVSNKPVMGDLVRFGQRVFFESIDGLYESDGTTLGTRRVSTLVRPTGPWTRPLQVLGDKLIFVAASSSFGNELWAFDGKTTTLLSDIRPGPLSSEIGELTVLEDVIVFRASDGVSGAELWKTDGTSRGTRRVRDIEPGYTGSDPRGLLVVGSEIYFTATTTTSGAELWRTDASASGTRLVIDLATGRTWSSAHALASLGDRVVFRAIDRSYETDGTAAGTREIKSASGASLDLSKSSAVLVRGELLFAAEASVAGNELWSWFPGASSLVVGRTCAGKDRAPRLAAGPPRLGTAWSIAGRAFAPTLPIVAFFGVPSHPQPIENCKLWVDLSGLQVFAAWSQGTTSWTTQAMIPNSRALVGITLSLQALQLVHDTRLGFDLTNAVHATLGQ